MPVTVTKAGNYTVAVMTCSDWSGRVNVLVDTEAVISNAGGSDPAATYTPSNHAEYYKGAYIAGNAAEYSGTKYFTKGDHTVTLKLDPRSGGDYIKLLDYVSLTWTDDPYALPEVDGTKTAYLELETYVDQTEYKDVNGATKTAKVFTSSAAHGGKFIAFGADNDHKAYDKTASIVINMPVTVTKAGNYTVAVTDLHYVFRIYVDRKRYGVDHLFTVRVFCVDDR